MWPRSGISQRKFKFSSLLFWSARSSERREEFLLSSRVNFYVEMRQTGPFIKTKKNIKLCPHLTSFLTFIKREIFFSSREIREIRVNRTDIKHRQQGNEILQFIDISPSQSQSSCNLGRSRSNYLQKFNFYKSILLEYMIYVSIWILPCLSSDEERNVLRL